MSLFDDDLEDRNIGKKLWLEEFFVSFCGAGGGVAAVGLTVAVFCCCVGEVGDVCCLEATGTGLLDSLLAAVVAVVVDDEDGEVAAVFSDEEVGVSSPVPVGSVRPFDFVEGFSLVGVDENFRLWVSLFKSSTLQMLFSGCSLVALSGTSHGCCFSEFGSILLFVIALC